MKVCVIIPAYNEEAVIGTVVSDIKKIYPNIVVIDDGSNDDTGKAAQEAGAVVIRHPINRGQGAALETGRVYALVSGADYIVTFDADGQHDPRDIEKLVSVIRDRHVDVALGSRFKGMRNAIPHSRALILRLALLHQWFFTGLSVTDTHCGLRAFTRYAAERFCITQDRMSHASEILDIIAREKLSYQEVSIAVLYSEYSLKKGQRSLRGSAQILYDFFIARLLQ